MGLKREKNQIDAFIDAELTKTKGDSMSKAEATTTSDGSVTMNPPEAANLDIDKLVQEVQEDRKANRQEEQRQDALKVLCKVAGAKALPKLTLGQLLAALNQLADEKAVKPFLGTLTLGDVLEGLEPVAAPVKRGRPAGKKAGAKVGKAAKKAVKGSGKLTDGDKAKVWAVVRAGKGVQTFKGTQEALGDTVEPAAVDLAIRALADDGKIAKQAGKGRYWGFKVA